MPGRSRAQQQAVVRRGMTLSIKHLILAGYVVFSLAPFAWMVSAGFKRPEDVLTVPVKWIPPDWEPSNFYHALFDKRFAGFDFARFLWNSTWVAAVTALLSIALCLAVGYGFAKFRFRGNEALMWVLLGTTLLPLSSIIIPLFLIIRQMELLDTMWALILPFAVTGQSIFLSRQFILAIPDDLIYAARVDGAGEFQIFRQIIVPLLGPAVTTVGVLSFLFSWNQFMWPLVVLSSQRNYTAPLGLSLLGLGSTFQIDYHIWMAAATLAALPPLIFFVILERPYMRGLEVLSGVKG